jgi:hypothetical protein
MEFPPSDDWVNHWRSYGIGKALAGLLVVIFGMTIVALQLNSPVKTRACIVLPAGGIITALGLIWILLTINRDYRTWGKTYFVNAPEFSKSFREWMEENTESEIHGPVESELSSVICYKIRGRKGTGKSGRKEMMVTIEALETMVNAELHQGRREDETVALATEIMEEMDSIAMELKDPLPTDFIVSDFKSWWGIAAEIYSAAGNNDWPEVETRLIRMKAIMKQWIKGIKELLKNIEAGGPDFEELKEDVEDADIRVPDWKELADNCREWRSELEDRLKEINALYKNKDLTAFENFSSDYKYRSEMLLQDWIASQLDEEPPVEPAISTSNLDILDRVIRELWMKPSITKLSDLDEEEFQELLRENEEIMDKEHAEMMRKILMRIRKRQRQEK